MLRLEILFWVVLPALNFYIWFQVGSARGTADLAQVPCIAATAAQSKSYGKNVKLPSIINLDSKQFHKPRSNRLVKLNLQGNTLQTNAHPSSECGIVVDNLVHMQPQVCLAVAWTASANRSYLLQRYKAADGDKEARTGFFTTPGNSKGRRKFVEKLSPLLGSLSLVEREMQHLLTQRGIGSGSDVVVMVVNEGEMDLFLNFACSCRHYGLTLNNIVVFAASGEIVPLIGATGALGYYHPEFASASRKSSQSYLDGVFIDMMWYKAFSVWLMLRLGHNVLFQDIDIVWFRDPFPYFHDFIARAKTAGEVIPDAFLSDDGQRATVRYSPFYANSGFYYLRANERTLNVAWTIMLSFDVMQSSGSHQNVFTQRLLEGLDLAKLHTQSMHQDNFTNGATYHHRPGFMKQIQKHKVVPYMFHMCWTANKAQKLDFFRKAKMWFTNEKNTPSAFSPGGLIAKLVDQEAALKSPQASWDLVGNTLCEVMEGAPKRLSISR